MYYYYYYYTSICILGNNKCRVCTLNMTSIEKCATDISFNIRYYYGHHVTDVRPPSVCFQITRFAAL